MVENSVGALIKIEVLCKTNIVLKISKTVDVQKIIITYECAFSTIGGLNEKVNIINTSNINIIFIKFV